MSRPTSRGGAADVLAATAALVAAGLLCACDKDPPKAEAKDSGAKPVVSADPPRPKPPERPMIVLDDVAVSINGVRFELAQPDLEGRVTAALAGKPMIENEEVEVHVVRLVKTPRVVSLASAIKAAKAKGLVVKTAGRDNQVADLPLAWPSSAPDCSAVGFIGKDRAISAWPVGGGAGQGRFAKGMAGPDMTLGTQGVRKLALGCESSTWFFSAEESVEWGLAFDLAMLVRKGDPSIKGPEGNPARATTTVLLFDRPVPGRKVDLGAKTQGGTP
jgi:hypothetical protein